MLPKLKFRVNKFIVRNYSVPGYIYIFRQLGFVKIGLSRTPLVRKRYLERDYGNLQIVAIVWAFNMKFIESQMHKIYAPRRIRREYWKSGFTEWFQADFSKALEMRIYLHLLSFFFNSAILIVISLAAGVIWMLMKK
jgi:hypothetical protein